MTHLQPLYPKSDSLLRCQKYVLHFQGQITAAKTSTLLAGASSCFIYDYDAAGNLTQAKCDLLSGGANDIPATTVFDSTSLGANMLGFVLDLQGQALRVSHMITSVNSTAGGTPAERRVYTTAAVAAGSATAGISVSAAGNIYGRITDANLDAATAGGFEIEIYFDPK